MAKVKTSHPTLWEALDIEEDKEKPKELCPHRYFDKTETVWPGETFARLTSTCRACRKVFGRFYNT